MVPGVSLDCSPAVDSGVRGACMRSWVSLSLTDEAIVEQTIKSKLAASSLLLDVISSCLAVTRRCALLLIRRGRAASGS